MILNKKDEDLDVRFLVRVDGFDYLLFATSATMKCFGCNEEGHLIKACPGRPGASALGSGEHQPAAANAAHRAARPPASAEKVGQGGGESSGAAPSATAGKTNEEGETTQENNSTGEERRGSETKEGEVKEGVKQVGESNVIMKETGEASEEPGVERGTGETGFEMQEKEQQGGETGEGQTEGGRVDEQTREVSETVVKKTTEVKRKVTSMEYKPIGDEGNTATSESDEEMSLDSIRALRQKKGTKTPELKTKVPKLSSRKMEKKKLSEKSAERSDSSDEEWLSDNSDVTLSQIQNQEKKLYPAHIFKDFLAETKNMKGLKIEKYFPDKRLFYFSARSHVSNKHKAEFTNQEVYRLKKLMQKVRIDFN